MLTAVPNQDMAFSHASVLSQITCSTGEANVFTGVFPENALGKGYLANI